MSKLNPAAKPFVFNAAAPAFVPGGAAPAATPAAAVPVAVAPATAAPVAAPAAAAPTAATTSAPASASSANPAATAAAPSPKSAKKTAAAVTADAAESAEAAARVASGLSVLEYDREEPAVAAAAAAPAAPVPAPAAAARTVAAAPAPSKSAAKSAPAPVADADDAEIAEAEAEEAAAAAEAAGGLSRLLKSINVVFVGHVDAGKSTLCGQILYLTGQLDDRTLDKFAREAAQTGRESWRFAWALDSTEQERERGKTQECGRGMFTTATKRWAILDAPGHRAFIPYMIGGASQADIAVLVVSARTGEFETGFDSGGQTREHAILAKTAGVRQLVVAINKGDDADWAKERFDEIQAAVSPFLRSVGFAKSDVVFVPVSGLHGHNVRDPFPAGMCSWYEGPPLLTVLDELKPPQRLFDAAFRLPISDVYSEMGVVVMGKLESGTVRVGERLRVMPNNTDVEVTGMWIDRFPIELGEPGDNLKIKLRGIDESDCRVGFVLCAPGALVPSVTQFEAQVMILESKNILCAGYLAVMHIHAAIEEVRFDKLVSVIDRKTNEVIQANPRFVKAGQTVIARFKSDRAICLERYKDFAQLGRFMLRDEGRTIGVGVVTKFKAAGRA